MTRAAFGRAAANPFDGQAPITDNLHHPPAFDGFETVTLALTVGDVNKTHIF